MRILKIFLIASFIVLGFPFSALAQERETFERFNKRRQERFDAFKEQKRKDFEEYRRKRNEEFVKFMRNAWGQADSQPITPKPKDETVPPVVIPKDDVVLVNPDPKPVPFEEVIPVPKPKPQPQPVDPIEEVPVTPVTPFNLLFHSHSLVQQAKSDLTRRTVFIWQLLTKTLWPTPG